MMNVLSVCSRGDPLTSPDYQAQQPVVRVAVTDLAGFGSLRLEVRLQRTDSRNDLFISKFPVAFGKNAGGKTLLAPRRVFQEVRQARGVCQQVANGDALTGVNAAAGVNTVCPVGGNQFMDGLVKRQDAILDQSHGQGRHEQFRDAGDMVGVLSCQRGTARPDRPTAGSPAERAVACLNVQHGMMDTLSL